MQLEGIVRNGHIVVANGASLPEGARVSITVASDVEEKPTLTSLLKLAGTAKDLPEDFAAQHDHYIHGTPKR